MNINWNNAPDWADEVGKNNYQELAWLGAPGYSYFTGNGGVVGWGAELAFDRSAFNIIDTRPIVWNGEGLPPVGSEIEAMMRRNMHDDYAWHRARVAHGALPDSPGEVLVFSLETTSPAWVDEFRPIRTPEQIVAEERGDAIREMIKVLRVAPAGSEFNHAHELASMLYDAGYRKQPAP